MPDTSSMQVKYRLSHHSVQHSKLLISPDSRQGAVLTRTTWRGEVNLENKSCSPTTMTVEERGNAVPGKWRELENCQISSSQSQLHALPVSHWSKCPIPEDSHTLQVTCLQRYATIPNYQNTTHQLFPNVKFKNLIYLPFEAKKRSGTGSSFTREFGERVEIQARINFLMENNWEGFSWVRYLIEGVFYWRKIVESALNILFLMENNWEGFS